MLLFQLIAIFQSAFTPSSSVGIDSTEVVSETDERFLSVAIDSHVIAERWKHFNFSSERVQNLAFALSPAYFRLGGTAADLITFKEKGEDFTILKEINRTFNETTCWCATSTSGSPLCENLDSLYKKGDYTMTGLDWIKMNEFSLKAGWTFLFDFNVLKRQGPHWDETNAEELLKFSSKLGYKNIIWELGNEPNSIYHQLGFNLTGPTLGKDFSRLKNLLKKFPFYKDSPLVGPDLNGIRRCWNKEPKYCPALKYLGQVMKNSKGVIDAITWHHYYLDGHTAKLEDFFKLDVLDDFQEQMNCVEEYLSKELKIEKPLWLGETSSAYGGGVKGVSDRYAAGFLWLDKLGLAALNRYKVIIRQSFYHGCYAMIGEDLFPNPDFWISYIYKQLVGTKVIRIKRNDIDSQIRIYAHCSKRAPGVVLFGLNLSGSLKYFNLESPLSESRIQHYALSPLKKNLIGRQILLNGRQLKLIRDKFVPKLKPKKTFEMPKIAMKPYEMGFWVFTDVNLSICN